VLCCATAKGAGPDNDAAKSRAAAVRRSSPRTPEDVSAAGVASCLPTVPKRADDEMRGCLAR